MGSGRGRLAVLSLAIVLVLAGCSSEAPETRSAPNPSVTTHDVVIDGVPFLAGATSGPGTEIGSGIDVVVGSRLLADRFPTVALTQDGGRDVDRGWTALVVVTGPGAAVVQAYAAQAGKLSLDVPTVRCASLPAPIADPTTVVSTCVAAAVTADGRRSFRLDYLRSGPTTGRGPISHLWITYEDLTEPPPSIYREPPLPSAPADPEAGSSAPWRPSLPVVGQGLEPGTENAPAISVVAGSRLAGPAGVPVGVTDPARPFAVLRVDGDLADVVAAYERAGGAGSGRDVTHRHRRDGGVDIDTYYWTNGDTYLMSTYRRTGRPTWLTIEHLEGD